MHARDCVQIDEQGWWLGVERQAEKDDAARMSAPAVSDVWKSYVPLDWYLLDGMRGFEALLPRIITCCALGAERTWGHPFVVSQNLAGVSRARLRLKGRAGLTFTEDNALRMTVWLTCSSVNTTM